jgi:hypothetical protein
LKRTSSTSDVELYRSKHAFVSLDGHPKGREEPLGRIEVHDKALICLDFLPTGGERLGIQAEIEDDFFRRRGDAAEVGIRWNGGGVIDDDLRLLLLLALGFVFRHGRLLLAVPVR